MPTPFTHLAVAARLLRDDRLPAGRQALLRESAGAFLLGNIAADARVSSGMRRENTHFYAFDQPVIDAPPRVMLAHYPALLRPSSEAQAAFVAGYVAHLTMDAMWANQMVRPNFAAREWAPLAQRILMLNVILIFMDQRDYALLEPWQRPALASAEPQGWTPFIGDAELRAWRDLIAAQLPPDGASKTLDVIGERLKKTPQELQQILDSPEQMQTDLWAHVSRDSLADVETHMVERARAALLWYFDQAAGRLE